MRFSSAAVCILAASPAAFAFSPSVRRAPFSVLAGTKDEIDFIQPQALISNNNNNVAAPSIPQVTNDAELQRIAAIETRASASAYLSQYEGQSGAAIVYSKLVENGVEVVNGFSGGAVLPLLDQFHPAHPRHKGQKPIRWITNSNESSAGHIAEGYGKSMPIDSEHKPVGVVIATSGPGLTNLITPLQDAICDGVPVVALCGQAATNAPEDAFQSAPAVDLTSPCTKWSYQIKSAAEIPMVLDYAFYVARNGRPGPVFVDLPKDLQNQVLNADLIDEFVQQNLMETLLEDGFVRMQNAAINMGTKGKGLPFGFVKDGSDYRMSALEMTEDDCDYHADHTPTNMVYFNDVSSDKVESGVLSTSSDLANKMLHIIRHARKPVILAGQGCNDAAKELKEFAEALQIPVATTLHALGTFDERNDLALNMVGMHGHPTPNFMFQEADLIISIGSRFDDRITGRISDYIPAARQAAEEGRGGVIHVDIRRTEHGKQIKPTYFVHSTGKKFLQNMNQGLAQADIKVITDSWVERMKELQAEYPIKIPEFATQQVTMEKDGKEVTVPRTLMSAQSVVSELDRQLLEAGRMDDAIFSTGVGVHQMIAAQLITWTQPRQMLSSGSLGTMGVALGYAIGAKLANGKKIVIAVDGDGSFNMTFTELKTLAEEGIPVKIMVIDNGGQMMVEYWQRLFHDNRLLAVRNSANPDYSTLAKAFGIKSVYCDAEEDLEACMKEFLFADPDKPVLFHVRVERTPCLPLVAPGQPLDDMILEDIEVEVDQSAAPS